MKLDLERDISPEFIAALKCDNTTASIFTTLTTFRLHKACDIQCSDDQQTIQLLSLDLNDSSRYLQLNEYQASWLLSKLRLRYHGINDEVYQWNHALISIYQPSTPEVVRMFRSMGWIAIKYES